MYHPMDKKSSYLRNALYKEYKQNCVYCGVHIQLRNMHVDHIIPQNMPQIQDDEISDYLSELEKEGFILDSIENYLPSCPACNIQKRNNLFKASNLRFFHEMSRNHAQNIIKLIELQQDDEEYFFEPVDEQIWKVVDFSYQRDISHAIMGYRLTSADVKACPIFYQVERIEKQINIVDHVTIQGETGCGKSITLFQTAYRFWEKGWKVYQLKNDADVNRVILPDNTEKTLFLIDDAQIFKDYVIDDICKQTRSNRKVLIAKTLSDSSGPEAIILTNKDSVKTLYLDFLKRKKEIWPIVRKNDNTIGVSMFDTPIEHRLENAKEAKTPWQFTYILRGGWRTMKESYLSVCNHRNCDLLVATIAVLQILFLDNSVSLEYINKITGQYDSDYTWTIEDISYLVRKKIVISNDEIRILHLESAYIIVALFFGGEKSIKRDILLNIIENEFINQRISPLGIVWLCNGCGRYINYIYDAEKIFLTESIVKGVSDRLLSLRTSEDVRDTLYLLEKIIVSDKGVNRGIQIIEKNEEILHKLICDVDSVSAWGFKYLINTLYNQDKTIYRRFVNGIDWNNLMQRMIKEQFPNYYSWGGLFNRGLSLLGSKNYSIYSEAMYSLLEWIISKARINNIVQTSWFISTVSFLNYDKIHDLLPILQPLYKEYFEKNMEEAIYLFDFDFLSYICGLNLLDNHSPSDGQVRTSNMIIESIPNNRMACVVSNSNMQDWSYIKDILFLIYKYNKNKYVEIMELVSLAELSVSTENSWDKPYDICIIIDILRLANNKIAKTFIESNVSKIVCFYSTMVAIDAKFAISVHKQRNIPLDIFTEHWWDESLSAIKAMLKADFDFTDLYLSNNIEQIAKKYSNVTALDFQERYSLDILKLIKKTNNNTYNKLLESIDKEKIVKKWDMCSGISPHQKHWVEKRKKEFFDMIS